MAQIFAYKGFIGINFIDVDTKQEKVTIHPAVLNDPTDPNQLGTVINLSHEDVTITEDAKNLMQGIKEPTTKDAVGAFMVNLDDENNVILGIMGGPRAMLDFNDIDAIDTCNTTDTSLLNKVAIAPGNEVPVDFMQAVDNYLSSTK